MAANKMQQQEINGAKEEKAYFLSVLSTFRSYREQSLLRIEHKERCLSTLPSYHRRWLEKYKDDLQSFKECIEKNSVFIPIVLQHAHTIFDNVYSNDGATHSEIEVGTLSEGLDKVQSVFKQLMRDWSSMGASERAQCYQPIIDEIIARYPSDKFDRGSVNVLVPGAGLGRLAFEIATRGFACQGNEFNLFMLIVSFYVLNHCKTVDEYVVYPWIHQYCNNLAAEHQMTCVSFPDVKPLPTPESKFSMTAGDFLEVYNSDRDQWHCVATCFFIDCAPNVVQFIETIYNVLKPGGLWINLGPLLYHYSDVKNEKSVEPSFEVLCEVIKSIGFEMETCRTGLKTKYCQNPKSMLQYEYDSVYFVCRKPLFVHDDSILDNHQHHQEEEAAEKSASSSLNTSPLKIGTANINNGTETVVGVSNNCVGGGDSVREHNDDENKNKKVNSVVENEQHDHDADYDDDGMV